jgi:signal peptidase I
VRHFANARPPEDETAKLLTAVVRVFGRVRLRVFGTSMVPSILPGDLIYVCSAAVTEIARGEIVLYSREGRLFVHRVVACITTSKQAFLVTRGDRLCNDDFPISSNELLGRVISVQYSDGRRHWLIRSSTHLNIWKKIIVFILQRSDRATHLYLRLASWWSSFCSGRASCQA